MIADKMKALGQHRSTIREVSEYANRRIAEIGRDKVFNFSLGNPSIPAPAKVGEVMRQLLENTDPVLLHGYTSAPGAPAVREKIAAYINRQYHADAQASLIYMTCGAAASLTVSLHAIVNPGDEVIVLTPFFPEYRVFAEKAGARLVCVACKEPDFSVDFAALEAAITEKTKALILNSPNNPTGKVLTEEEIQHIASLLTEKKTAYGTDIFLLADEPYRELTYGDVTVPYIPLYYPDTIVCYSFSKSLSLPGERIGYIAVFPQMSRAQEVYDAVCGAGRALGFVCAPSLLQYTVAECMGETADLSAYKKNRDRLYQALTADGYETVHPDGAFYLFVKAPGHDSRAFCERARRYELMLVPGDDFGCPGYVRIAYCVDYETIERSLPAFAALIEEYRPG